MENQSVTQWIDELKDGEEAGAHQLWKRYFIQLTNLARRKLQASNRRVADEEDVALSAFDSFCRSAQEGRFPRLNDRDDLWRLLFTIIERKAIRQVQHERRLKRGGGDVQGESLFGEEGGDIGQFGENPEPSPELAAVLTENVEVLLALLGDSTLSQIAVLKMEGFTNLEIAERLESSERSVKRKLAVIRSMWTEHLDRPDSDDSRKDEGT